MPLTDRHQAMTQRTRLPSHGVKHRLRHGSAAIGESEYVFTMKRLIRESRRLQARSAILREENRLARQELHRNVAMSKKQRRQRRDEIEI